MASKGTDDPSKKHDPDRPPRGFARLTPEQRRKLGSLGGATAHARGTANKFTPESASAAGRVPHERGTAHKWSSEQAREAGKKGGAAPRSSRASRAASTSPSISDDDTDAMRSQTSDE